MIEADRAREFRLVAACCRWPPSPRRNEAIRSAATARIDWSRLLRVARRHRVGGLVHDGLKAAGVGPPSAAATELATEASRIIQHNLAFAAECARLQRLLDEAKIPFLIVKGVTLGVLAYGSLAHKKAWDIDLVVPPDAVEAACARLSAAGYRRVAPAPDVPEEALREWLRLGKEMDWTHERNGIPIELHWGLVDNKMLLPGLSSRSAVEMVEIAPGVRLPTLRREELFAYICVHGACHAWSRLKWIADVAALIKDEDAAGIDRLYRSSLSLGAGRTSGQALLLCERLFGMALTPALKAELESDAATGWLVESALRIMLRGGGEEEIHASLFGTLPIQFYRLFLGKGWRYKVAELKRRSLSPVDRVQVRLPRGTQFLYPLLRVPLFLWRRARIGKAG